MTDDDPTAIRKRMADYERDRLRKDFPDIDKYNDDLVLAIAEHVRNQQSAKGSDTMSDTALRLAFGPLLLREE